MFRRHPRRGTPTRSLSRHRIGSGATWRHTATRQPTVNVKKPLVLTVAFLVLAGAIIWGWRISDVRVSGATLIPNAVVRDAALVALAGKQWVIFPNTSIIVGGYRAIPEMLREEFAFTSVTTDLKRHGVLELTVQEQDIAAIVYTTDGASYLVGAQGDILLAASPELREALLATEAGSALIGITWNVPASALGDEPLLSTEQLRFLKRMWDTLAIAGAGLQPDVIVPRYGATEDFDIRTRSGAIVTTTTQGDTTYQITKLNAVLHDRQTPEERQRIRSVDLRYDDRVYVQ
ncbi:MAG: hypothetical protein Q7S96_03360 [bacterium]|nr:hypothetical protein [bacterium]